MKTTPPPPTAQDVIRVLRATAHVLTARLTQAQAAIARKIGKKAKIIDYDIDEVVGVLATVEDGWRVEDTQVATPASRAPWEHMVHKAIEEAGFKHEVHDWDGRLSLRGDASENEALTRELMEVVKRVLPLHKDTKNVEKLKPGAYAKAIKFERNHYGSYAVVAVNPYVVQKGRRIIAPDGDSLVLSAEARNKSPMIWTWLYGKHEDIVAKCAAASENPELLEEQARTKLLKKIGRDAGRVGQCSVCENYQRLELTKRGEHPHVVLHGYERPGGGYIIGSCFGVNYPPYELSSAGCSAWQEACETKHLPYAIANLKRVKAMTSMLGFVVKGYNATKGLKCEFYKDGTFKVLDEEQRLLPPMAPTVREGSEAKGILALFASAVKEAEEGVEFFKQQIARMKQKVASWKPQPLPGTSQDDQAEMQRVGSCPGSGTMDYDRTGKRWGRNAKCNVCGQVVPLTSAYVLRKHDQRKQEEPKKTVPKPVPLPIDFG